MSESEISVTNDGGCLARYLEADSNSWRIFEATMVALTKPLKLIAHEVVDGQALEPAIPLLCCVSIIGAQC
jgi:hypothetical protein